MTVRAFRSVAAQACAAHSIPYRHFRDNGLEDVLELAADEDWSATEIAAQVLCQCCLDDDGRFNNFQVALLSVMTYLNEQRGRLGAGEQQAWKDLVDVLKSGDGIEAVRKWMQTHYS